MGGNVKSDELITAVVSVAPSSVERICDVVGNNKIDEFDELVVCAPCVDNVGRDGVVIINVDFTISSVTSVIMFVVMLSNVAVVVDTVNCNEDKRRSMDGSKVMVALDELIVSLASLGVNRCSIVRIGTDGGIGTCGGNGIGTDGGMGNCGRIGNGGGNGTGGGGNVV